MEGYLDDWQKNQDLLVNWGVTGMSVRRQLDDKWTTLIDIYPDCISLITKQMFENAQIPENIYNDYLEVLYSIDGMKSAYSSKKRYMRYDSMSTADIEIMMESINSLIDNTIKIK